MEAGRDSTSGEKPLRYTQYRWGDGARGIKAQLQALGIGENVLFPGEQGGPKRSFSTTDPRGFPVTVRTDGDGLFWAAVSFPGRQKPVESPEDFAPGVTLLKGRRRPAAGRWALTKTFATLADVATWLDRIEGGKP